METVTLIIDGNEVEAGAEMTILDACREQGIEIPTLCYDPAVKPYGGCRLCVVEVEGMKAPVPSCATRVAEGMKVKTASERVIKLRKLVIDLLLSNHNADCRDCSSSEICSLRKAANDYGVTSSRFTEGFHKMPQRKVDDSHPFITRDNNRCILCARCVRVCREHVGMSAITLANKGFEAYITTAYDVPLQESTCVSCGSCVAACPTGALQFKDRVLEEYKLDLASCIYCGLCVETCPHQALENGSEYELAEGDKEALKRYQWKKE